MYNNTFFVKIFFFDLSSEIFTKHNEKNKISDHQLSTQISSKTVYF